jgi:flavorubredoxin
MNVHKILDNLYMFNSLNEQINLSFNQYLLLGEESILFHTGSHQQAQEILPGIKALLDGRSLNYIFVSHFESDECGGLTFLLSHFPEAKTICSPVTARQLLGFGFNNELEIKNPGETLKVSACSLDFISYPSEMHLWEGLLVVESKQGILFSSDLFIRFGNLSETIITANWEDEIKGIESHQIPSPEARKTIQETLLKLPLNYVAPGHGPVLKLEK